MNRAQGRSDEGYTRGGGSQRRQMSEFTHLDESGRARMVDVSAKGDTVRIATARGRVLMRPETLHLIKTGGVAKGDVLAIAQVAGVMGAKRTSDIIPLCHPLPIT